MFPHRLFTGGKCIFLIRGKKKEENTCSSFKAHTDKLYIFRHCPCIMCQYVTMEENDNVRSNII